MDVDRYWLIVGQVASVIALHIACHRYLRRYMAVQFLIPSLQQHEDENGLVQLPQKSSKHKFGASFDEYAFYVTQLSGILQFTRSPVGRGEQISRGALAWLYMVVFLYTGLPAILPMQFYMGIPEKQRSILEDFLLCLHPMNLTRTITAALLPIALLYTTINGYRFLHPIVTALLVLGSYGFSRTQDQSVRRTIFKTNLAAFLGLLFFVTPGLSKFASHVVNVISQQETWFRQLWSLPVVFLPAVTVRPLLDLALRFDFSFSPGSIQLLERGPGKLTEIPRKTPSFEKPTYIGGMMFFVMSLILCHGLSLRYDPGNLYGLSWTVLTVPVVTIGILLMAIVHGRLGSWWQCEEQWSIRRTPADTSDLIAEKDASKYDEKQEYRDTIS